MRIPWLILAGHGLIFGSIVEGAPGKHHKRKPYDTKGPSTSSEVLATPIGYNYGYTPSTDAAPQSSSQGYNPQVSGYPCTDWILCPSCPEGYYCPSTEPQSYPAPTSLVILPTCASWKACAECRGGYKCWKNKPTSTRAPVETTSSTLTIIPTCYPWNYCYSCVGGYTCPSEAVMTTVTIKAPKPVIYPTCPDYILCDTCDGGYICPSTLPTKTYTIVITKGTLYTTVTETVPGVYGDNGFNLYGTSDSSEPASTYDWAAYEQPTCTDYIICPTCAVGYYCPSISAGSGLTTPIYYQVPGSNPTSASLIAPSPSFYPPPPCDDYVVCVDCFLGYYCPTASEEAPYTSPLPPMAYGLPPCDDYIVCPTCPLGYYCPPSESTDLSPSSVATPKAPDYGVLSCLDYIVCPTCPLGYYCPTPPASSEVQPTSTYDWASYGQPTCSDYVVCPTCISGYYCPNESTSTSGPKYSNTPGGGNGYSPKPPNAYIPSTTYYIGLPTTTLVVAPTCSEYVLCPVCAGGYYCPSISPVPTTTKSPPYYYSNSDFPGNPTPTPPPCDVYVFCPECNLGYSCLVKTPPSTPVRPKTYKSGGTANPPMLNPYPLSNLHS